MTISHNTPDQLRRRLLDFAALLGPEPIPRAWLTQLLLRDQGFLARQAAIGPGPHTEAIDAAIDSGELLPANESHSLLTLSPTLADTDAARINDNPERRKILWSAITRLATERARDAARDRYNPRSSADALRLLPLVRRLVSEDFSLVALTAANTLVHVLLANSLLDEGEKLFAFLVEENNLLPNTPRAAVTATNLGALRQKMRHPRARETWEHALNATQAAYHPDHAAISRCHAALAEVLADADDHASAQQHLWQALAIARRNLSEDHVRMAPLYLSAAVVLVRAGKEEESLENARRSASILEKSPDPNTDLCAQVFLFIATIHVKQRNFAAAREPAEKALALRLEKVPEHHASLKTYHNMLAVICRGLQDFPAARRHYEAVIAAESKLLPPEHPALVAHHFLLASLLEKLDDRAAERAQIEKTLALVHKQSEPNPQRVASLHYKLAQCLRRQGQLLPALDHFRKAVDLHEKHQHPKPLETAVIAWMAAQTAHIAKNFGDMRFFLEKARPLYEKELPPTDPRIKALNAAFAILTAIEDLLDNVEEQRKDHIAKRKAETATPPSNADLNPVPETPPVPLPDPTSAPP